MGKQKEEAEETQAVDSDYSGRPLGELTPEEVRASFARGEGMPREDRLVLLYDDGTREDAVTGEKLPPRKPSPAAARPRRPWSSQRKR